MFLSEIDSADFVKTSALRMPCVVIRWKKTSGLSAGSQTTMCSWGGISGGKEGREVGVYEISDK